MLWLREPTEGAPSETVAPMMGSKVSRSSTSPSIILWASATCANNKTNDNKKSRCIFIYISNVMQRYNDPVVLTIPIYRYFIYVISTI